MRDVIGGRMTSNTNLFGDLLSGWNEGGGTTFAGVVGLDDVLAVADAVVGHQ